MARPEKEAAVQDIAEILDKAKGVFVTDFEGLNVEEISEFRSKCRESSVQYLVVKNTLAKLAADRAGWNELENYFSGPSALAFSYDDPAAPARVIKEFTRKFDKPQIKVSIFEGMFYGPDKVEAIASLPSKEELLTRMVRGFNNPIHGLVGNMSGIINKLVRTLEAVRQNQQNS